MDQQLTPQRQAPQPNRGTATNNEAEIRQVLESMAEAVRIGDLERIFSFYAPDIAAFDMMPPLQFIGKESYRKPWQDYFLSAFEFPVTFDTSGLKVFVNDDLAFCFGLVHVQGTMKKDRQKVDNWIRGTTCLRKIGGSWLIVHEHNSVPVAEDGRALMDLKPELGVQH